MYKTQPKYIFTNTLYDPKRYFLLESKPNNPKHSTWIAIKRT